MEVIRNIICIILAIITFVIVDIVLTINKVTRKIGKKFADTKKQYYYKRYEKYSKLWGDAISKADMYLTNCGSIPPNVIKKKIKYENKCTKYAVKYTNAK